ncbi:hypothetical protein B0H17DRAFT_1146751 [Mycena rosella]|uniref:Uncharacterized protein n=1 Tax=Mycena rosella TaxID=1033263 RepID=A0AAD7G370_MYCRO|nr:hypothetical protein B0H17DRAFT_1146751 [Mycena rosella]
MVDAFRVRLEEVERRVGRMEEVQVQVQGEAAATSAAARMGATPTTASTTPTGLAQGLVRRLDPRQLLALFAPAPPAAPVAAHKRGRTGTEEGQREVGPTTLAALPSTRSTVLLYCPPSVIQLLLAPVSDPNASQPPSLGCPRPLPAIHRPSTPRPASPAPKIISVYPTPSLGRPHLNAPTASEKKRKAPAARLPSSPIFPSDNLVFPPLLPPRRPRIPRPASSYRPRIYLIYPVHIRIRTPPAVPLPATLPTYPRIHSRRARYYSRDTILTTCDALLTISVTTCDVLTYDSAMPDDLLLFLSLCTFLIPGGMFRFAAARVGRILRSSPLADCGLNGSQGMRNGGKASRTIVNRSSRTITLFFFGVGGNKAEVGGKVVTRVNIVALAQAPTQPNALYIYSSSPRPCLPFFPASSPSAMAGSSGAGSRARRTRRLGIPTVTGLRSQTGRSRNRKADFGPSYGTSVLKLMAFQTKVVFEKHQSPNGFGLQTGKNQGLALGSENQLTEIDTVEPNNKRSSRQFQGFAKGTRRASNRINKQKKQDDRIKYLILEDNLDRRYAVGIVGWISGSASILYLGCLRKKTALRAPKSIPRWWNLKSRGILATRHRTAGPSPEISKISPIYGTVYGRNYTGSYGTLYSYDRNRKKSDRGPYGSRGIGGAAATVSRVL